MPKTKEKVVDMRDDVVVERLVREIFHRRADGQSGKDIAKALNVKPWLVSDVLHRKRWAHVTIGHDVMKKVEERFPKRARSGPRPKTTPSLKNISTALADYTAAAVALVEAEQRCKSLGLNSDTLDMLRLAIRES